MKVGLIHTKKTLRADYLLECCAKGVEAAGDTWCWVDDHKHFRDQLKGVDVGIQVCYPNKLKGKDALNDFRVAANQWFLAQNKRLITIDTGFVRNQSDYELEQTRHKGKHDIVLFDIDNKATYEKVLLDIYYEVGYDGLKRYADYGVGKVTSSDRWDALRTPLKPWRKDGEHILLIGQTVHGLSSQHINIYEWYAEAVKKIREVTQRPIVFRSHPRINKIRREGSRVEKDRRNLEAQLGKTANFRYSEGWTMTDDLRNAWATVVFTSNAATQSVIAGIPVFTPDPCCMAYDVADHDVRQIEKPRLFDRQAWANRLAYSQWNCQEMIDGLPWQHLRPHALKPPLRLAADAWKL